jgi:hypothetical protein
MFSSRLTLQGDDFSSDTAIDLPQPGGKGHQKFTSRVRAGGEPCTSKKESQHENAGAAQIGSREGR